MLWRVYLAVFSWYLHGVYESIHPSSMFDGQILNIAGISFYAQLFSW